MFCRTMIMFPARPLPSVRCGTEPATNRIVMDVLGSFDAVFNRNKVPVMSRTFLSEAKAGVSNNNLSVVRYCVPLNHQNSLI